ncbi:MAG: hypothetical protein ACRCXV_03805, partial [Bacteroidales bacterium]
DDTVYLLKETAYLLKDTPYNFDNVRTHFIYSLQNIFFAFYLQHLQQSPETLCGSGFSLLQMVADGCR